MEQRRLVRALPVLALLVVLGVVACGGEETAPTSVSTSATLPASVSSPSTTSMATTSTLGPGLVDGLPRDYVQDLGIRPIVVLFYVPGGLVDEQVLSTVTELRNSFRGYAFLLYDYSVPSVYGDLAMDLAISYQPGIVLIDRHGAVEESWTGYVDKATLNQLLVNLGRE